MSVLKGVLQRQCSKGLSTAFENAPLRQVLSPVLKKIKINMLSTPMVSSGRPRWKSSSGVTASSMRSPSKPKM